MRRVFAASLILSVTLACQEAPDLPIAQAGLFTTVGGPRTWTPEPPPPDTIRTVTRRVWYGEGADFLGSLTQDGRMITYHEWGTGDLAIRDLATGETQNLTNNPAPYYPGFGMFPTISRDGSQVAYSWYDMGGPDVWQLRVVDVEGSEARVLCPEEWWINPEDWSPDGTQIAAFRALEDGANQIVLVSAEDGSLRVLKEGVGPAEARFSYMKFSPDGRYVLYDSPTDPENEESRDLFLLPVEGGPERRLLEHPANDIVFGWSPDGGHILFASDRIGTLGAWILPVADGAARGDPMLVKPDLWEAVPMHFVRDGRFFYGVRAGRESLWLATLDPETGEVVGPPQAQSGGLVGTPWFPSWSPDGRHLVFLLIRNFGQSPRTLVMRAVETGEERHLRLPTEMSWSRQPLWTSDGRTILIRSQTQEREDAFYRVDVVTGVTVMVFTRGTYGAGSFDILPGGEAIVYASQSQTEGGRQEHRIVVRNLASGNEREIYRRAAGGTVELGHIVLSPDGGTLAVLVRGGVADGLPSADQILLLPIGGGEPRELVTGSFQKLAWLPNGRFLLLRAYGDPEDLDNSSTHLLRVAVETGEVEDLGLGMEGVGHMSLSKNGRHLVYIDGVAKNEVWVMEGFLPGSGR